MAAPEPPAPPPAPPPDAPQYHGTPPWLHNAAIAIGIAGPAALLLPPRRVDLRFTVLSAGTCWAVSQLVHDWTGRSLHARAQDRVAGILSAGNALPDRAQRNQVLMRAERARREAAAEAEGRKEAWLEERKTGERYAPEERGKGVWDLISDQVWEVWNQSDKAKKADSGVQREEGGGIGSTKGK